MDDFYETVYGQDTPRPESSGWIQWKGTDVCIDLHCACGDTYHYDGDFLYFYRCAGCGTHYAVGQVVKLIPLTTEQQHHVTSVLKAEFQEGE